MLSLSEALSNECEGSGVTVTASCPGPTITEFGRAAGFRDDPVGDVPAVPSKVVARLSFDAMMRGRRVEIIGRRNKLTVFLSQVLPRRSLMRRLSDLQERGSV